MRDQTPDEAIKNWREILERIDKMDNLDNEKMVLRNYTKSILKYLKNQIQEETQGK